MLKVTSNALQTTRLGGAPDETTSMFGPLTDLIGTWVGRKGWNLVAVPNQKGGFLLLVQPYTETLTITPLSTPTPNRGTHIVQQVPTLLYSLSIHSNVDGSLLHAENGTWLPFSSTTYRFFNASGLCQYCGAASITTRYWLSGL